MINSIRNYITTTDIFPVAGGSIGAVSSPLIINLPSQDMILGTIILAALGATIGYIVKLILDYIVKKCKNIKH